MFAPVADFLVLKNTNWEKLTKSPGTFCSLIFPEHRCQHGGHSQASPSMSQTWKLPYENKLKGRQTHSWQLDGMQVLLLQLQNEGEGSA